MRYAFGFGLCVMLAASASAQSWLLVGNAGTSGSTNFIGTTDSVPLNFRSNNQRVMTLFNELTVVNTDQFSAVDVLAGHTSNTINPGATASTVFGGLNLNSTDFGNHSYDIGGTISGGANNFTGTNDGFLFGQPYATVSGGIGNWASGNASSITGGRSNRAAGVASVVPGGENNTAGGDWSFAGGFGANVRTSTVVGDSNGDEGTFIWADKSVSSGNFSSTGPNQFIIRATGGVGIGTNTPHGRLETSGADSFSAPQFVMNASSGAWSRMAFTNSGTGKFWHFAAKCNGANPGEDELNYYYQDTAGSVAINPMQIRGDGRIAIGGGLPETGITLKVSGTVKCTALVQTSSGRYKNDVQPLPSVLDRFLQLRPVSFTWDKDHGGDKDVGLIAEEVAAVFPEAVATIDGKVEGINYSRVTALAIQAMKEQQQTVASLRAENAELKARMDRIEKLMSSSPR